MSLYQNTILKKQIAFNSEKIGATYKKLVNYFHNPEIQENIRKSKEEEWQEGFMRALFVNILGYTFKPEPKYNLISEKKNETDGKKADGAILVNDEVKAVIELKDTKTTDLKQFQKQAFDYKNNHRKAAYVITSNFEKLRFYIENTIDYQEFNLFTLTQEEFAVLWICLAYENIAKDLPKLLKNESTHSEDQITKELYKEYSSFKRALYADMLANNNATIDKGINPLVTCPLVMFKKSQKLLDRFLFILFAEDCGLLPPNSIKIVVDEWETLKELDAYKPLYERFKKYFGYMNTGFKGKKYDVFPYNGGLFLPDEILDNISISDEILCSHLLKMSKYDFSSEIDVNILGHIFEHSLTEIEEITNEITTGEDKGINPLVNKRKKDGVFYTPRYITTYIVENTLGKLCAEKKTELEIDETEYTVDKNRPKTKKVKLEQKLLDYRNWLLTLTICDPACGSGAFLNAALDFLMAEHKLIDEMRAKIYGNAYHLYDNIENAILENNLYGVDINEESVEIAKLALWLRTAKPQRKLNSLNDNIKCGNSLISPSTVTRGLTRDLNPLLDTNTEIEKAFDWHKEFPQVFKEKVKKAFHVTTAIHDSRTSERMVAYKVRQRRFNGTLPDPQVYPLDSEDEFIVTKTIFEIVKEDELNVLAYNICCDHLHILLVCEIEELDTIVKKIKGKTARVYNSSKGINPLVKKESERSIPLWTQKFGHNEIFDQEQLYNTIEYIQNNRTKHELPTNKGIHPLVEEMCCNLSHAFRPEYKGGFDVVIGNPPYVQVNEDNYKEFETVKCGDLYAYFFERGLSLLKTQGFFSYITPNLFIKGMRYESLRNFLLNNSNVIEILDKGDGVFEDVQMPTAITTLRKEKKEKQNWSDLLPNNELINKICKNTVTVEGISKIMRGLEIGKDKIIKNKSDVQILSGEDIYRYGIFNYRYISNNIYEEYKKDNNYFEGNRIITRETGSRLTSIFIKDNITQQNRSLYSLKVIDENKYHPLYILTILNSQLIQFFYQKKFAANTNIFPKIRIGQLKEIPIIKISIFDQQPYIELADKMLSLNSELQTKRQSFLRRVSDNFSVSTDKGACPLVKSPLVITGALERFYELVFKQFIAELKKQKIALSLKQQDEWEEYFNEYKQECCNLVQQINETDREIDGMVYGLYGLTEEEIGIVEKP
jgi:type I restriction-modification system DNA methylase subunit/REP element-mobilizing transposase RayT